MHTVRDFIRPVICFSALASCLCGVLSAQSPAVKPAPVFGPNITSNPFADVNVTIAAVRNGAFGTALLAVFANDTSLSYAVSVNATEVAYSSFSTGMPGISCSPSTLSTCWTSIANYDGKTYIAYVDNETRGLDVVVAEPVPGQPQYVFHLVHQDSTFSMLSSPTMTVFRGNLVIYFNGQTPSVHQGFFGIRFNGEKWLNLREITSF